MIKETRNQLEKRIIRLTEYHLNEYAMRLEEIGGIGVGGAQLESIPLRGIFIADSIEKKRQIVLSNSIMDLWSEGCWSYVHGHFRGCIVLMALIIERALKLKLELRNNHARGLPLSNCIKRCQEVGILPSSDENMIVFASRSINYLRNDVIHANFELNDPESILHYSGPEHEKNELENYSRNIKITEDGSNYFTSDGETLSINFGSGTPVQVVYPYKKASFNAIMNAKEILGYLFPNNKDSGE